jgi:hypothetical protein
MRVSSATEFEKLLEAVAADAFQALDYRRLSQGLMDAHAEYAREFAQTPTFWWLQHRAAIEAALNRLGRLYDQHAAAVSLRTLLTCIMENLPLFDAGTFRQRLAGRPFVESLAQDARRPDLAQLDADRRSIDKNDPMVRKLVALRNTSLAHRDLSTVLGTEGAVFPWGDVDILIERAVAIVNRYSMLYRASLYTDTLVGHDDYTFLLRMIQHYLVEQETRSADAMGWQP